MTEQTSPGRAPRPGQRYSEDGRRLREVHTYAQRGSRFSSRQARAWQAYADDWVIPERAVQEPDFGWDVWFGRSAPLCVEVGSGVGEATAALAARRPEVNVLALEVWRPGVAETLDRLAQAGVTNARLCGVDATWALEHLLGPESISELWTFFPDPWHKTKHHKRRLISPPFSSIAASRLVPGGVWRLATDWQQYADRMVEVLDAEPLLAGGVVERWGDRPMTKFERKGRRAERSITDLAYTRIPH